MFRGLEVFLLLGDLVQFAQKPDVDTAFAVEAQVPDGFQIVREPSGEAAIRVHMRNQKVTVPSQIRHNPGLIRAQAAIPQQVDSGLARRGGLVIIAPEIPEGGRDTFGVPGRRETPRRVEVFGYFPITAGPASLLGIVDGGEDSLILRGRQCQIDNPPGLVHQAGILVLSPPIHAERVANVVPPWAELNVVIPLRCSGANAPCRSPVEVELQPCFQGPQRFILDY